MMNPTTVFRKRMIDKNDILNPFRLRTAIQMFRMQTSKTFPVMILIQCWNRFRLFAIGNDGLLPGELNSRWNYA